MSLNPGRPGRLGAILLATVLLGACGAGATQSPATTPAPAASPAAVADEALVADMAALWSNPYDAAEVAALYAPDAAIYDEISGSASATGLEAIRAKVEEYAAMPFKVKVTSAPIRQGDYVAVFQMFGSPDASNPGFMVLKLKNGKVQSMWMYPAE